MDLLKSDATPTGGILLGDVQSETDPTRRCAIYRYGTPRAQGGKGAKWMCCCPSARRPCEHLVGLWNRTLAPSRLRVTAEGAFLLAELGRGPLVRERTQLAPAHDLAVRGESPILFTIGHGGRDLAPFLAQLRAVGVTLLVDVRTFPTSRWSPHFMGKALAVSAPAAGIGYRHMPELGGYNRDKSPRTQDAAWQRGIGELAALARDPGQRVAIFCMETRPEACHRCQTVEPALRAAAPDVEVVHLPFLEKLAEPAAGEQAALDL